MSEKTTKSTTIKKEEFKTNFPLLKDYNNKNVEFNHIKYSKDENDDMWYCSYKTDAGLWNNDPKVANFSQLRPIDINKFVELINTKSEIVETHNWASYILSSKTNSKNIEFMYFSYITHDGNGTKMLRFHKDGERWILDRYYDSVLKLENYIEETDKLKSVIPLSTKAADGKTISDLIISGLNGKLTLKKIYSILMSTLRQRMKDLQSTTKTHVVIAKATTTSTTTTEPSDAIKTKLTEDGKRKIERVEDEPKSKDVDCLTTIDVDSLFE